MGKHAGAQALTNCLPATVPSGRHQAIAQTMRNSFLLDPARVAALDETQAAIKGLEGDIRSVKAQMAELKTVLYAKFGNSVSTWGWHTEEGTGPGVDGSLDTERQCCPPRLAAA